MYQKFFGSSFANFKWVISPRNSDNPSRFCAKWNCFSYKGSLKMHFRLSYHFNSFLTQWGTSGPNSERRFWWLCQSAFPRKPPMVPIHTRWTKLLWDWERCGGKVSYFSLVQKIAYEESKLTHTFVTFIRNYLNARGYTFWERYLPSLVAQVDEINGTYYSE